MKDYFETSRKVASEIAHLEASRNSLGNLLKDRVFVFADGVVWVVKGKCTSDSSLKCEERKHVVDVYGLLHSRQASSEEVENLLAKKEA